MLSTSLSRGAEYFEQWNVKGKEEGVGEGNA